MAKRKKAVKCVVWDLDETLWRGVLLEDASISLRDGVGEAIRELDRRGILLSIASRNDATCALEALSRFDLSEFFLYPQIGWQAKSASIKRIAECLNVGVDTLAFIDDDAFELAEVAHAHPGILCLNAREVPRLVDLPAMMPRFITDESAQRRVMYRADIKRCQEEESFAGPKEDFLASLCMVLSIGPAGPGDLQRAEELTIRTNQLNSTGYTYSFDELDAFRQSPRHLLLIAELQDRYGSYGKIGLAVIELDFSVWTIKLLLMSCRVMSRGVGSILINEIKRLARQAGVRLTAEFVQTPVNRMMYVTYKFAYFSESGRSENRLLLEADLSTVTEVPPYVELHIDAG